MKYDFFHFAILVSINLFVMLCVSICINVDEGASYLTLFCYRPVSLVFAQIRLKNSVIKIGESEKTSNKGSQKNNNAGPCHVHEVG